MYRKGTVLIWGTQGQQSGGNGEEDTTQLKTSVKSFTPAGGHDVKSHVMKENMHSSAVNWSQDRLMEDQIKTQTEFSNRTLCQAIPLGREEEEHSSTSVEKPLAAAVLENRGKSFQKPKKTVIYLHTDIIGDAFWNDYPKILLT